MARAIWPSPSRRVPRPRMPPKRRTRLFAWGIVFPVVPRKMVSPGGIPLHCKFSGLNCQTDLTALMGTKGIFP